MENRNWNTGASVPVNSLTPEELKEAIHEWAEGSEELEQLLWTCYGKGLETSGCHVGERNNYLGFYVDANSIELLKRTLSTVEAYGNAETFLMFGGNPVSGPNWYRTDVVVECLIPENVGEFYNNINRTLETDKFEKSARCFELLVEFAEFFEDKLPDFKFRMRVRNHCEYEFLIERYGGQSEWTYLKELLCSLGMRWKKRKSIPLICWYIRRTDEEEFYNAIKTLLDAIRSKWNLKPPAEVIPERDFNFNALLMHKKFGTTPDGLKKMNEWIIANYPVPDELERVKSVIDKYL